MTREIRKGKGSKIPRETSNFQMHTLATTLASTRSCKIDWISFATKFTFSERPKIVNFGVLKQQNSKLKSKVIHFLGLSGITKRNYDKLVR